LSDVRSVSVISPAGEFVWCGEPDQLSQARSLFPAENTAVDELLQPGSAGNCTVNDVTRTAERLRLVSRRNMPTGTYVVLPRGRLIDESVTAFNLAHLANMSATPVDFPLTFDARHGGIHALTTDYRNQKRVYRLGGSDSDLRLSYAADPNLLTWLEGECLNAARLPHSIYSPQQVFRRFQSGEVSLQRARQYPMPDVHTLSTEGSAAHCYCEVVKQSIQSISFWFGLDYLHIIDTAIDPQYEPGRSLLRRIAQAVPHPTVVRHSARQEKYYAIKGGLYVNAGYTNLMLYNFQLDYANPERFSIRANNGESVALIHSTLAGGWPKIVPIVIGRGLAKIGPQALPIEIAREQVTVVARQSHDVAWATKFGQELTSKFGVRIAIDSRTKKSLRSRIADLRNDWRPAWCVVGERERAGGAVSLVGPGVAREAEADDWLVAASGRIGRCQPAEQLSWRDLPISARSS